MPKQPVKVYLDTPQRDLVAKIARIEESSMSEVLRNALLVYAHGRVWTENQRKKKSQVSSQ